MNTCAKQFTMTPGAATSLSAYWTFDKPGEPTMTPFGPAFIVNFTDQTNSFVLQRFGTGVSSDHRRPGIISNAGFNYTDDGLFDDAYGAFDAGLPPYDSSKSGFSLFGWFQFDAIGVPASGPLLRASLFGGSTLGVEFDTTAGLTFVIQPSGTTIIPPVVAGVPFFIAYTYNCATGEERLYIGPVLVYFGGIASIPGQLSIEIDVAHCSNFTSTRFDELGYYNNRILTPAQIVALYNGGAGVTWPAVNSV